MPHQSESLRDAEFLAEHVKLLATKLETIISDYHPRNIISVDDRFSHEILHSGLYNMG